jgi:hypothetical protein
MQHANMLVNGRVYLCLHTLKLIHPALDRSDPLHRTFYLVHPLTDIPLEGVLPLRELGRGEGSGSMAWSRGTVRIVWTTTLMIPQKATPVPSVPLGLRGSLSCCFPPGTPAGAWWSWDAIARAFSNVLSYMISW